MEFNGLVALYRRAVPVIEGPKARKKKRPKRRVGARIDADLYDMGMKKIPPRFEDNDTNAVVIGYTLLTVMPSEEIEKYLKKQPGEGE